MPIPLRMAWQAFSIAISTQRIEIRARKKQRGTALRLSEALKLSIDTSFHGCRLENSSRSATAAGVPISSARHGGGTVAEGVIS